MSTATTAPSVSNAAPVDRRTAWKILISVVVVTIAVGSLLYASTKEGAEYYKFVDEVVSNPANLSSKRLQVHGYVVEGSIEKARDALDYRFKMETRPPRAYAVMEARYKGIVPDTFKSGSEVVAIGRLTADNKLAADDIKAKCPSKYEAKQNLGEAKDKLLGTTGATGTTGAPGTPGSPTPGSAAGGAPSGSSPGGY
jgi:cytochrome c-type biogenesis protein CcmE